MTSVNSNNLNLKYQMYTSSGCRDIGIRKLGFVAKTQFLCKMCIFKNFFLSFDVWCGLKIGLNLKEKLL